MVLSKQAYLIWQSCRGHSAGTALLVGCLLLASHSPLRAETFDLPGNGDNVVGEVSATRAVAEDTISDLARAFDQGYNEMRLANPTVEPWLPRVGSEIVVPGRYVLPDVPYEGIVVNVPEMRLYYFPPPKKGKRQVVTYPVSIGRQDWMTPKGLVRIIAKQKDPAWYPPESIRREHAEKGDPLPKVVPPGPDNPLGRHAMRLSINGYLIHGTDKPAGIGMRVTHGCIRMYPVDVESLFAMVAVGTKVRIVNQPFKVGRLGDTLQLEVHPYLEEDAEAFRAHNLTVMQLVVNRVKDRTAEVNWEDLQRALQQRNGIPAPIGMFAETKVAAR